LEHWPQTKLAESKHQETLKKYGADSTVPTIETTRERQVTASREMTNLGFGP
jgi:hypothetical protein